MIDVSAWSGLQLLEPVQEGNRNEVWRARLGGADVAVRKSRRSEPSLVWELDLLDDLDRAGFGVPTSIRCDDGRRFADGVVVQVWLDGRPPSSDADWKAVADELQRLHAITGGYRQRPGCVTVRELADARRSVDTDLDAVPAGVAGLVAEVFDRFGDVPTAVVHGDRARATSGSRPTDESDCWTGTKHVSISRGTTCRTSESRSSTIGSTVEPKACRTHGRP